MRRQRRGDEVALRLQRGSMAWERHPGLVLLRRLEVPAEADGGGGETIGCLGCLGRSFAVAATRGASATVSYSGFSYPGYRIRGL